MRNVTGRIDPSDPLFTDEIMLDRLDKFISLDSTQDIRLFRNYTWWEFQFGPGDPNPYPVDLQDLGFSTIQPQAYCDGFKMFWYESPGDFFMRWPETQQYTPQRPTDVLYYNNELLFRGPPNKEYSIKIQAYEVSLQITSTGVMAPDQDYLYRYYAYGAAMDIFSDYGELDQWNNYYPIFKRYRNLVYGRTNLQYQNQRPDPEF